MNGEELADANRKLRAFAAQNGMQWVLAEVDEAIALGIVQVREMRPSTRMGQTIYEDVASVAPVRGRRRVEEFVSRRPMSELEQVRLLVAALRRVLVDLDDVAAASVSTLNDPELRERAASPPRSGVESGPDEWTSAPAVTARRSLEVGRLEQGPLPEISEIDFAPDEGAISPPLTTEAVRHGNRRGLVSSLFTQLDHEISS